MFKPLPIPDGYRLLVPGEKIPPHYLSRAKKDSGSKEVADWHNWGFCQTSRTKLPVASYDTRHYIVKRQGRR